MSQSMLLDILQRSSARKVLDSKPQFDRGLLVVTVQHGDRRIVQPGESDDAKVEGIERWMALGRCDGEVCERRRPPLIGCTAGGDEPRSQDHQGQSCGLHRGHDGLRGSAGESDGCRIR